MENRFVSALLIFLIIDFSGIFVDTVEISLPNDFTCICPGFKREICSFGPSGNIVQYSNLCEARCRALSNNAEVGIMPSSSCQRLLELKPDGSEAWMVDEWIKGVKEEAKVWKKVNRLLSELLELSSGGAPPCVCPGLRRIVCTYGPSGNIVKYDSLCSLKCQATKHKIRAFGIGPCPHQFNFTVTVPTPKEDRLDDAKELDEWYKYMEVEIEFYRKISDAMDGLFPEPSRKKFPYSADCQ